MRATSLAAGIAIKPKAPSLRRQVLQYVASREDDGATLEEIEKALELAGNTVRPRRVELEEQGLVVDSGRRRPTSSGRMAIVWIVPPAVRRVMARMWS